MKVVELPILPGEETLEEKGGEGRGEHEEWSDYSKDATLNATTHYMQIDFQSLDIDPSAGAIRINAHELLLEYTGRRRYGLGRACTVR